MSDGPTDPARRLAPVVRLAPAKVNLTLAITGTRPDGYHELHSVMVPLDLADEREHALDALDVVRRRLKPGRILVTATVFQ